MNDTLASSTESAAAPAATSTVSLRIVYGVLILASLATITGRIMSVESARGGTPMLSANDRSRWAMARALVDHGTFAIDAVVRRDGGGRDPEWQTIDRVRHRGWDGREHDYSSKPPLLGCLVAAQYAVLKAATGVSIAKHPFYVIRLLLITTNVIPFGVFLLMLVALAERWGRTAWGKVFVVAAGAWGTFLSTFAVTLNNHLPAAISVMAAVWAAAAVFREGSRHWGYFALAGLAGAFAVTNELPALSFLALLGLAFLWHDPMRTLLAFAPPVAIVAAAFFVTTYVAHGSWRPPYAHRSDGPVVATLPGELAETLRPPEVSDRLRTELERAGIAASERAVLVETDQPARWSLWDPATARRLALVVGESGLEVRQWDNWYDYEGTYWSPDRKSGVDRGEPSRAVYAFHVLVGHRGIFSLTPIWLLSILGLAIWLRGDDRALRWLAVLVVVTTVVCLTFYVLRPLEDRNYGGVSCGFRWMFWFIPLWLLAILPAADAVSGCRTTRAIAWLLLFISIASAAYTNLNPWSQSWLFDYWTSLGWLAY